MRGAALHVAIVLATLAVAAQAWAADSPAPDRDALCKPVRTQPVPASQKGEIVLPVIVHYMKSTGPNHAGNDIAGVFTESWLSSYFDEHGFANDTIWRQANIRLFLHVVEICDYDPVFTGQIPNQAEEIGSPSAGSTGPARFRRVNDAYNYRKVSGLDLYFWWEISGRVVGHGKPHRLSSGETTTGAVWVDRQCLATPSIAEQCRHLIAHEAGHFLGLCHVCKLSGDSQTGCTSCVPAFCELPDCGSPEAPRHAIMRSRYDGTTLNACEIERAAGEARHRIRSTPR